MIFHIGSSCAVREPGEEMPEQGYVDGYARLPSTSLVALHRSFANDSERTRWVDARPRYSPSQQWNRHLRNDSRRPPIDDLMIDTPVQATPDRVPSCPECLPVQWPNPRPVSRKMVKSSSTSNSMPPKVSTPTR